MDSSLAEWLTRGGRAARGASTEPVYTATSGKTISSTTELPTEDFIRGTLAIHAGAVITFFFPQRNTKESCVKEPLPAESTSRGLYRKAVGFPFSWSTNIGFSEAGSVRKGEKPSWAAFPGAQKECPISFFHCWLICGTNLV